MKLSNFLIIFYSVFAVIMISGCITSQHYDDNGISFNYPSNWKTGAIQDLPGAVAGVSESGQVDMKIFKNKKDNGTSLKEVYDNSLTNKTNNLNKYCYKEVSNRNLTVDGVPAYEIIYQVGCNSTQTRQKIREVWLEKNGNIYTIICTVIPPEDFPEKNPDFDGIINSLHIN